MKLKKSDLKMTYISKPLKKLSGRDEGTFLPFHYIFLICAKEVGDWHKLEGTNLRKGNKCIQAFLLIYIYIYRFKIRVSMTILVVKCGLMVVSSRFYM